MVRLYMVPAAVVTPCEPPSERSEAADDDDDDDDDAHPADRLADAPETCSRPSRAAAARPRGLFEKSIFFFG